VDDRHYAFDSSDASCWTKSIPEYVSIDRPSDKLCCAKRCETTQFKHPVDNEKLLYAKSKICKRDLDLKAIKKIDDKKFDEWSVTNGIADKIRRNIKTFQEEDIY